MALFIATLIAADRLTEHCVRDAGGRLVEIGCGPSDFAWLDEGSAATFGFQRHVERAKSVLKGAFQGVDVVVQKVGGLRKRLLVADMDSTMITVECIDELADYAGLKPQVAAITDRAMAGELDFAAALAARVALLGGMPEDTLRACLRERVRLTPGARELVATMRAHGAGTLLVSGGFTAFADPVAAELGFDEAIANRLEISEGLLTGRVLPPIVDAARKAASLDAAAQRLGIARADVLAVGDGANDIAMIEAAGLGFAYRAKPALADVADAAIVYGDLTTLLWAQGYKKSEWATTA